VSYTSIDASKAGNSDGAYIIDFISLLKPRVMSLVVFTGFVGLFLAPGGLHPILEVIAIFCIAIGAGASGAINMWFDRDIDSLMSRTKYRPIPAGRVTPEAALTFGVLLGGGSVMIMGLAVNWLSAFLLAFTIGFYIFVYTIWLKRRTPQNIVIGGAAGALPPMIGWSAVSGTVAVESIALFIIIFVWTPPHFWALSLYRSNDYRVAGVPMLPLTHGKRETCRQILVYSVILGVVSLLPCILGTVGILFGAAAFLLGALFLMFSWRVFVTESEKNCRQLFGFSIVYLFLLFTALVADRIIDFPQSLNFMGMLV